MDRIRDRLSTFRRPSKAPTLASEKLTNARYVAPENLPDEASPSISPIRCPPGTTCGTASLRGPPSAHGAESLPPVRHRYQNSAPLFADYDTAHFVIGGGVAIFHLATSRVVLCWHSRDRYWFLPKGRRDVNEESGPGAEREGFEESGYRNRLLPLPFNHRQPESAGVTVPLPPLPSAAPLGVSSHSTQSTAQRNSSTDNTANSTSSLPPPLRPPPLSIYATEPILTQLLPVTSTRQYLLHWYIAETLPPAVEAHVNTGVEQTAQARGLKHREVYVRPPAWPARLTLQARVKQDRAEGASHEPVAGGAKVQDEGAGAESEAQDQKPPTPSECRPRPYEPVHHPNTAVDAEEALYQSELVPVEEAIRYLEGSGMEMVVRWGWEAICRRWAAEELDEEDEWSEIETE